MWIIPFNSDALNPKIPPFWTNSSHRPWKKKRSNWKDLLLTHDSCFFFFFFVVPLSADRSLLLSTQPCTDTLLTRILLRWWKAIIKSMTSLEYSDPSAGCWYCWTGALCYVTLFFRIPRSCRPSLLLRIAMEFFERGSWCKRGDLLDCQQKKKKKKKNPGKECCFPSVCKPGQRRQDLLFFGVENQVLRGPIVSTTLPESLKRMLSNDSLNLERSKKTSRYRRRRGGEEERWLGADQKRY